MTGSEQNPSSIPEAGEGAERDMEVRGSGYPDPVAASQPQAKPKPEDEDWTARSPFPRLGAGGS
jgi:hypothetical protein